MTNPYANISDYCFWSRSMTKLAPWQIDPCTNFKLEKISAHHKVSTMGSCFAQHLGRYIENSGLNFYKPEMGTNLLNDDELKKRNYGIFSARYGNIYTVKQLLQLFQRAFNNFLPEENFWKLSEKYVDPFRPQIEPDGFLNENALIEDRNLHLSHVRDIFYKSDFLIITLGLTEGWRSKVDGAVFPIAPGVHGGRYDPDKHEFINFSLTEIENDLELFINSLKAINSSIKIILTVSPVPLAATYENRHVLVSTNYSKSVLRVVADNIEKKYNEVVYFPSYEIITSPTSQGHYYQDDFRQITDIGVKHVMRVFDKHFLNNSIEKKSNIYNNSEHTVSSLFDSTIVCDEELIEKSLNQ
jgi:hypothetical protein